MSIRREYWTDGIVRFFGNGTSQESNDRTRLIERYRALCRDPRVVMPMSAHPNKSLAGERPARVVLTAMVFLNRAVAALRVVDDDLLPDEISTLMGVPPTRSFARGDEIRHRRAPIRVAKFGLWTFDAPETQPADLDTQVSKLLRPLTQELDAWRGLAERFSVDLFCGWFMKFGNEGLSVAPATLTALAERHIDLDLDIYAGDGDLVPDWGLIARRRESSIIRSSRAERSAERTHLPR